MSSTLIAPGRPQIIPGRASSPALGKQWRIDIAHSLQPHTKFLGDEISFGVKKQILSLLGEHSPDIQDELMAPGRKMWNFDGDAGPHSVEVAYINGRFAEVLCKDPHKFVWPGLVHDIGKVLTPPEILNSPNRLPDDQKAIMNRHAEDGYDILRENKQLMHSDETRELMQIALEATRSHHERWDGRGYPDNLDGNDIPFAARLTALSDVYQALTAKRTYKPGLTPKATLKIMNGSPGHFDPELLDIFTHEVVPHLPGNGAVDLSKKETLYEISLP